MFPGNTRFPQNCKLSLNGAILFISLTDCLKINKFLENGKLNMSTIKKMKSGFRTQYDLRILEKQHSYWVRFAEFEKTAFVLSTIQEICEK